MPWLWNLKKQMEWYSAEMAFRGFAPQANQLITLQAAEGSKKEHFSPSLLSGKQLLSMVHGFHFSRCSAFAKVNLPEKYSTVSQLKVFAIPLPGREAHQRFIVDYEKQCWIHKALPTRECLAIWGKNQIIINSRDGERGRRGSNYTLLQVIKVWKNVSAELLECHIICQHWKDHWCSFVSERGHVVSGKHLSL